MNLGKNIIHLSAEGNQPSLMIFFLFKKIIDISTKDNNNSTPLHWACFSGAYDSVKFLISLNAEINAMDKNELTPLHIAVLHGRKNIVIKLLQYGAIKEIENSRGEIAIYLAWKKKYKEIYNILNKKEFYPLWSIKEPLKYVEPNDIYKISDLGEAKNAQNINQLATFKGSQFFMSPHLFLAFKNNYGNV